MIESIVKNIILITILLYFWKGITIGSSADVFKYFSNKEYRKKYNDWMSSCPK